ncbi:MAG: phospholipid carrier-dependent glycosyltransferase [Blastocatellia bacterium]
MILEKLRPHLGRILLVFIFIVLSSSTVVWTISDRTPPPWDPADHISAAYDYYSLLARLELRGFAREIFAAPHYYAPMVHLTSAIVFLAFGASRLTGIAVNLISLAWLMWALSYMARTLYGQNHNERVSAAHSTESSPQIALTVLPALVCACYHFSAWLMHDAFLDFPLIAAVAVSFALLIRAGDFKDRRAALLFGISVGIGLLVKQTFAFFFVLPVFYVALRVLFGRDRRAIANLALAAVAGGAIAAVWYAPHFRDVIAVYHQNRQAALDEGEAPVYTFDSNFFYVHALISMQMQLPLGLLFLGGVLYSLVRCRRESTLLYLWLLSGIVVFALVANKDVRYTVPVLPAAALLSLCWLRELRPASGGTSSSTRSSSHRSPCGLAARTPLVLKLAPVAAIAMWSLVSFFNAQWPRPGFGYAIDTPRWRWMVYARNYYGFDHRPLQEDWSVPDIVRTVAQKRAEGRRSGSPLTGADGAEGARPPLPNESVSPQTAAAEGHATLGVVVNLPYLNPSSVALEARLMSREPARPPVIRVEWIVVESAIDRLDGCDYLLVRTGLEYADWTSAAERQVASLMRAHPERFTRVASFPIPLKEAEAVIYRLEK